MIVYLLRHGWLEALVRHADGHPNAAAVGSKLIYPNDTIQHAGVVFDAEGWPRFLYAGLPADHAAVNTSRRFQAVSSACALVRREPFMWVGGFDTGFSNGFEDVDLCLRFGELGHDVCYCHESVLYHLGAISRDERPLLDAHNCRLYHSRWAYRVQPDDMHYYVRDGMMSIRYQDGSPPGMQISPYFAMVNEEVRSQQADRLLERRSRQVFELLQETIRLTVRVRDLELQLGAGVAKQRTESGGYAR